MKTDNSGAVVIEQTPQPPTPNPQRGLRDPEVGAAGLNHLTGTVRAFDRAKAEETRTVEFVISDETRDRHGTVIPIGAWNLDNFNRNGIVGYQHEVYGGFFSASDPDDIIGLGEAFVEDGKLVGRVTFEPAEINPKAEKIFRKVLMGTLKATSVGFVETKKGKWGEGAEARGAENATYYFGEVELLEFSIVNIPSNPNAMRRKLEEKDKEFKEAKEREIEELKAENGKLMSLIEDLRMDKRILQGIAKSRR